jgi:hypothetical protein
MIIVLSSLWVADIVAYETEFASRSIAKFSSIANVVTAVPLALLDETTTPKKSARGTRTPEQPYYATMKFRPLSIDYHFRAQEIIATERDIRARRATLRTLPNPSPPCNHSRCRHRHWNGDPDDDGTRSSLCDAYIIAGEKERTSALSNANDENYFSMRQEGKRSGSEEDHQSVSWTIPRI